MQSEILLQEFLPLKKKLNTINLLEVVRLLYNTLRFHDKFSQVLIDLIR